MQKDLGPNKRIAMPVEEITMQIARSLQHRLKGRANGKVEFASILRVAMDEVIDPIRTNRFSLRDLKDDEVAYLADKIKIVLGHELRYLKGQALDLIIDNRKVHLILTLEEKWGIPSKAFKELCFLLRINEPRTTFDLGVLRIGEDLLQPKPLPDGRRVLTSAGVRSIHWLHVGDRYPPALWSKIPLERRSEISLKGPATERVASLFRNVTGIPISIAMIKAIAQSRDPLRSLRKSGTVTLSLAREGINILAGRKDFDLIETLKLPTCTKFEFISSRSNGSASEARIF